MDDLSGLHVEPPGMVQKHLAAAEAALMLVESLMLALVARRVLGAQQVIEAVEAVIETKRQLVEQGSHPNISAAAAGLVSTIANSLLAMAEETATEAGSPSTGGDGRSAAAAVGTPGDGTGAEA